MEKHHKVVKLTYVFPCRLAAERITLLALGGWGNPSRARKAEA
jgi:hypothetical protein